MNIGIVGHGVVGRHLVALFSRGNNEVSTYDKADANCVKDKMKINKSDIVFIAVPTPSAPDGSCDISAVEEVVHWVTAPICIKSTVPPGTVNSLSKLTGKRIVFSPEYVGETPFHQSTYREIPDLVVVGGEYTLCNLVLNAYRVILGPEPRYFATDAVTAELSKYMENCFFATKVAFVGQFYLFAAHLGVDFTQLREIWTADTRVGRSHSTVTGQLGFGGKCLPKDITAMIAAALAIGMPAELLRAVDEFNKILRRIDVANTRPRIGE